jgi:hypothetical protein
MAVTFHRIKHSTKHEMAVTFHKIKHRGTKLILCEMIKTKDSFHEDHKLRIRSNCGASTICAVSTIRTSRSTIRTWTWSWSIVTGASRIIRLRQRFCFPFLGRLFRIVVIVVVDRQCGPCCIAVAVLVVALVLAFCAHDILN